MSALGVNFGNSYLSDCEIIIDGIHYYGHKQILCGNESLDIKN